MNNRFVNDINKAKLLSKIAISLSIFAIILSVLGIFI